MGKKVRSAKGVLVDFDYLKIKEQLATAPTPIEVKERQDFIENRLKRRLKKKLPVIEKLAVDVAPALPGPEDAVVAEEVVEEEPPVIEVEKATTTKQKARKKKTT